ncbi:hypothetical protein G195_005244 [Phytophthora kernoviae 00238/432]|nr:hypothetical protein G195_005244 [Phytophthora kernoviae 00238/432]
MATLIPHVLPCLRDHNSKIALSALEILELLVTRVAETTLRSYFKLLWVSIVERLGDNKLPVREKAVDVVVEISVVLDIPMILEKLKVCMQHKNWRTREQSLHAVWRCLERHNLFKEKKDVLLDDVLKLLEDSSKDVRDAAVTALENFYTYIGPSLLSQGVNAVPEPNSAVPDELTSILSTYDLQVSSSSSMARYLASVRSRTQNEAKTADPSGGDEQSLPRAPSTAPVSVGVNDNGISERDIQKQLGVIFDKLQLDNNWSVRVDGLKMLQKLAGRCSKAPNSDTALPFLSQGIRSVRERLCEQVIDLRSSVSREACQAIQMLANTLRDDFNGHAEYCLGNLLKATYVTIQVISTAADTTVRSMIESTNSGYVRVIPK